MRQRQIWRLLAATTAAALLAAGCSSGGGSGSKDPIKIGALDGLTGTFVTSEVAATAKQVFDDVNASGGINGRKIDYIVKDDAGNPQRTAQVARELVSDGVVAMAGSASFTDCAVNSGYYKQQKIDSIMGVGADPTCYTSPNIAPVNVGPYTLITEVLQYASEVLHDSKLCNFTIVLPGSKDAVQAAIDRWSKLTGKQLLINDMTVQQSGDLTPYLLRAKQAGCDAVLFNPTEQLVIPWLKIGKTQGMTNTDFLVLASAYSDGVAKAADPSMKVYAGSEFEPYTLDTPANQGWRDTVTKAHTTGDAFSQGGYVAAQIMVQVLKSIKGDITRDSVDKALKSMQPVSNPLIGSPYVFGPGDKHAPNQSAKMVKLDHNKWVAETPNFITLPAAS